MTDIVLMKAPGGALMPVDEQSREVIAKWKLGQGVHCKATRMRNVRFFRKWWALAHLAFEAWSETVPTLEYKGDPVLPNFDRFRRDLTILAGFYRPVFNAKGELRLEAESIAWGNMTEERFEKLYNATIDAVLQKILPKGRYTEQELRNVMDQIMAFA